MRELAMKNQVSPVVAGIIIAVIMLIVVIWIARGTDPTQRIVLTKPPSGPMILPPSQQHRIPLASVLPPSQKNRVLHVNPNYVSPVLLSDSPQYTRKH